MITIEVERCGACEKSHNEVELVRIGGTPTDNDNPDAHAFKCPETGKWVVITGAELLPQETKP